MRMVPLGRTGIEVSEIILGGGTIGGFGGGRATEGEGLSDEEALLILEAGAGLGIKVASSPDVTATLVGVSRPEQFADIRDALELHLDPDQRDKLARLVS